MQNEWRYTTLGRQDTPVLIVVALNLRVRTLFDGPNRWSKRIDSVVAAIRAHNPAIFATQEGLHSMLQDLLKRLPDYRYTGEGRDGGQKEEHCAIFYHTSCVELLDSGQFWLSRTPEIPSKSWASAYIRICTWARFQSKRSKNVEFFVFNTHLDNESQEAREQGSNLIWRKMREITSGLRFPALLTGDFNALPESRVIRFWRGETAIDGAAAQLTDVLTQLGVQAGTFHGFHGGDSDKRLDYIFATPGIRVLDALVDDRKFLGRYPSDHYGVKAVLQLPNVL